MRVDFEFKVLKTEIDLNFGVIQTITDADPYEGEYEVVPKVERQILETEQKLMTEDLLIHGIPFYEVSNDAGGTTVYIGKEI